MNKSNVDDVFQSIYNSIRLGYCSLTEDNIIISRYDPVGGSSYIKLPKELDNPRKGLINIQNIVDSECFKWSIVKYVSAPNDRPARITRADKDFAKSLILKT